jgi:hypothetical protein
MSFYHDDSTHSSSKFKAGHAWATKNCSAILASHKEAEGIADTGGISANYKGIFSVDSALAAKANL